MHKYSCLWAGTAALGILPLGILLVLLLPQVNVNITLFSCVTLISKVQSTSDLDYLKASDLARSRVKSHDDQITDCRRDSAERFPLYIQR